MCGIFSNHSQLLKKRRMTMEEWDDKFFESSVKKKKMQKQSPRGCSVKKVFLEILQTSQEDSCAKVSFLIKLQT